MASYAGLELTLKNTITPKDNNTPEFLAMFPRGKVPAFKGADGLLLTESTAIARYGKCSAFIRTLLAVCGI